MSRTILMILILGAASGCWNHDRFPERSPVLARGDEPPLRRSLPIPTSTEVLLVNGKPLSVSGYFLLREQFPRLDKDQVLWMAMSALALQDEAKEFGRELTLSQAIDLTRYSLELISLSEAESALKNFQGSAVAPPNPLEFRRKIEKIVAQSVVQRNPQVLAELH